MYRQKRFASDDESSEAECSYPSKKPMTSQRFVSDDEVSSDCTWSNTLINKKKIKKRIEKRCKRALAVVDLDETLIDKNLKLYPDANHFLKELNKGHHILLWTLGDRNHVECFYREYPECKRYIDQYFCGPIDKTKPVNHARKLVYDHCKTYFPTSILVDDNSHHLAHSYYDFSFDVKSYYLGKGKVNYASLISDIKSCGAA